MKACENSWTITAEKKSVRDTTPLMTVLTTNISRFGMFAQDKNAQWFS
jgi:hypothetical protein